MTYLVRNRTKYDFKKWFESNDPITLTAGEDFDMKMSSFKNYLFRKAKEHGVRLRSSISSDMTQITFCKRTGHEKSDSFKLVEFLMSEKEVVLTKGQDFNGRADSFREKLYRKSRKLGFSITTKISDDMNEIRLVSKKSCATEKDKKKSNFGENSKYKFDQWFGAGEIVSLKYGVDFHVRADSFRSHLLKYAKNNGHKIRASISEDQKTVIFWYRIDDYKRKKYDFEAWLSSGKPTTLTKGIDFEMTVNSFKSYLYQRAKDLGYKVVVSSPSDKNSVVFIAVKYKK